MSKVQTQRWELSLVRQPTRARWEVSYTSPMYGRQIWASGPWLCPIDPITEAHVVDELWWAVLEARGENYKR